MHSTQPSVAEAMETELDALHQRIAELETRERELRALLESTPQAILIHNERPLYCNLAAARLFGFDSPAELLALSVVDGLLAPESRAAQRDRCQRRLGGEDVPSTYEMQAMRQDGTRLWLSVAAQRVTWEGGVAVHCIFTDISDRKRTEDELRTFRRVMRGAMNALPQWVGVKDTEGRYLLANDGLASTYGRRGEELEGYTAAEVGSRYPDAQAKMDEIDHEVLAHGNHVDLPDFRMPLPDGSERIRHVIKSPLRDESQRIIGLVGISLDVTEQRRADDAVCASQRLLDTVINSLPLWLMVKDREGRCILANQAMADVLGSTPEALVGLRVADVARRRPDEQERSTRMDRAVMETGQPGHEPASRYTLPDGTQQIRDLYKFPLLEDDGRVKGLVAVSVDVTDRVDAERQHEADRRLLQSVVDTIPHFVFVKDRESRYRLVNHAMAEAFGVPREDLLGCTPATMRVATPGQRAGFARRDQLIWDTESSVDERVPVTLADGRVHVLHEIKTPLRDDTGTVVGMVGVSEDVTEQQAAQEALGAQQRLLQAVFDAIPAWLYVKDRDSRFLMVNGTLARELGTTPSALQGTPHERMPVGTPEQRARILESDRRLLADGLPQDTVLEVTLPDGRPSLRHLHKVPLHDEQGTIVGIVGMSEDITERREMEEQLRRMQRMEAIGTLAGGIAHDFNNILFPIIGFTELTMRTLESGSTAHRNLSIVRDAGLRAKDIVSQILTFSRRSDTKPEVMPLRPLVRESLRFLRSTLPRTVLVEEAIERDVSHVHADAVQMHQVLMNLCVNAAHAMPEGGTLQVGLANVELNGFRGYTGAPVSGRYVCLSVTDSGVGIAPEALSRIFEPFYTTKPVGQGTGLGLSTVLGIVTQHEGVVDVRSSPGHGSCFSVYLRAVPAVAAEPPADEVSESALGDATILFVDDEWAVAELSTRVLEEQGYRVVSFTSSTAALSAFKAHPDDFDLVITDQMMPELTGDKLAEAIHALRPDLPILLGTGFSEVVSPEGARTLGIDAVFYKPITPDRLVALVRSALDRCEASVRCG